MADPLTLLRQYNINRMVDSVVERDDQIIFNTLSFLKTAKTNYVIGSIGRTSQTKEYYTLEALLFLLKNVHLSHPIYVQRAGAANVPVVRFPDRKDLLAYLNGEKETTNNIDKSAPLVLPVSRQPTATLGTKRLGEEASSSSKKAKLAEDSQQKQDLQEWLSIKLGTKKEGAVTTQKIMKGGKTGLNEVMSVDRIAEIKRKIMTRKRATIKGDDDYNNPEVLQAAPREEPAIMSSFLGDPDNDMTKDILSRERQLRTRTSVLQSNGKQFLQNILAILQSVKAIEDGKALPQEAVVPEPTVKEPVKKSSTVNRYDRYDQERFDTQKDTEGFKIDTMATFQGLNKEGKSPRRSMPSPSPHTSAPNKSPKRSSGSSSNKPGGKPEKRQPKTPIIIVPASGSALVTLYNVKDFLQDYKFVSVDEKKRQGVAKEPEILIQRKKEVLLNGQMQAVTVPFRVTDSPLKLTQNEWQRVAAVFLQGPAWQFKGWPWLLPDGSPVEIFTKIKAFYVQFEGMKVDPNVLKWDVHSLLVNQTRRHRDRASVMKFWESLEKFLLKNKPNLRF